MSEQDGMDRLLREATASQSVPNLSPAFERRLAKSIRPARLKPAARLVMILYVVAAVTISIWLLRGQPLADVWLAATAVVLVPLSMMWAEKLTREDPSLLRRKRPSV
jgi:hypothetical protein